MKYIKKDMPQKIVIKLMLLIPASIALVCFNANALKFKLSQQEFDSWDMRCKAYYVMTDYGAISGFKKDVPKFEYDKWDAIKKIRSTGPWHYCSSLIWIRRAKTAKTVDIKEEYYRRALSSAQWTYARIDPAQPWSAEMAVTIGTIYQALEEFKLAHQIFDQSIQSHADYIPAYAAKSILFRKQGKLNKAINVLEQVVKRYDLKSPEIFYFLGLFHFENNNFESAALYGKQAYQLGYPLPALRIKLKEQGYNI